MSNKKSLENMEIKKSLWRKGKEEYKKFGDYHFKRSTFWKTTLLGLLFTLILVLPFIFLLVALFNSYFYLLSIRILLIVIAWALLSVCNGVSNYFTVELSKRYVTDDIKLQQMDSIAIMFYNCLNIGFMIFTLVLILFIFMVTV